MIIANKTGASVYVSELDVSFAPENEVASYKIGNQDLLKSMSLRNLIRSGALEPISTDGSPLEKDLLNSFMKINKNKIKEDVVASSSSLVLRGQFLDYSGYAKVNRNLADVLINSGNSVKINALDYRRPRLIGEDLKKSSKYNYVDNCSSSFLIDSVVPNSDTFKAKKRTILYTTVESYTIPDSFSKIFNSYDELWVTSNFCKSVISCKTNKEISVVPGVVDFNIYKKDGNIIKFEDNVRSFRFVSVFNWSYRKGPDALIKAYCRAFSGADDVSLILLCRHKRASGPATGVKNEVEEQIRASGSSNPPSILRITKELDENGIASLYRSCNCFVLPSRGEGYGLPYLEASLCGIPVIGTDVSAIKDILNNDNSCLVPIDGLSPVPNGATGCYFWDNHIMADLTSDNFINLLADRMRHLYENYNIYVEKNKVLQKQVIVNASGEQCMSFIKQKVKEYL
jgi:glycosyltransferase involved in cell wall biosynthesis